MTMIRKIFIFIALLAVVLTASGALSVLEAKGAFNYDSLGKRDPFVPLVGVSSSSAVGGVLGIITIDDVVLGGIMTDTFGKRSVVINGEILDQGQGIGRLYIESIGNNSVTIRIDDVKYELELYE